MKETHAVTLILIFKRPTSANINWKDIEALLLALGAEISEREGSRIGVRLFNGRRVFHRPHPSPKTDKGAVASIREWLKKNEVMP
ncbi:MAG: type II toxin-antitoxin system HicA family toxin [Mariprofundaceae bacterium]